MIVAAAGWLLVATATVSRAGIFDSIMSAAEDQAKNAAMDAAKQKMAEMAAEQQKKDPDGTAQAADKFVGEYAGKYTPANGAEMPGVAKVFSKTTKGEKTLSYFVALWAVESGLVDKAVIGKDAKTPVAGEFPATVDGQRLTFKGQGWAGWLYNGKLTVEGEAGKFDLDSLYRKSPTEFLPPPPGSTVLLACEPGKAPSLNEWANHKWTTATDGSIAAKGGDNDSKKNFTKFKLHLEFCIPPNPPGEGNSGVYVLGRYEVQIIDSFGHKPDKSGCGAIYMVFPPEVNATLPNGRWQTYDIAFTGATMEGDKAVKHPVITVEHNGVTVQKDVEIPHATGQTQRLGDVGSGPIRLQDHGSPVKFRNIWIQETP
jgi:hypothetical protein